MFFVSCVSHACQSVHCCLVVTCWERADCLALVGDACYVIKISVISSIQYTLAFITSFFNRMSKKTSIRVI